MQIVKSSGERAEFDPNKIVRTAVRAGASRTLAERIAEDVSRTLRDGITTREIFQQIMKILDEHAPPVAARFSLSQALQRLGPAGFDFEKYIAGLLKAHGYDATLPDILQGACVTHEVDVLATKDNRTAMIEAKFRQQASLYVAIKDTLATWSRFLDLVDGSKLGKCPHVDECWIVTNTRFSPDSLAFAHCKNMVLIGWNHPEERSLARMIDDKALYPVTVLRSLDHFTQEALARGQVMLVRQLIDADPAALSKRLGIPEEKLRRLAHEAEAIINLSV